MTLHVAGFRRGYFQVRKCDNLHPERVILFRPLSKLSRTVVTADKCCNLFEVYIWLNLVGIVSLATKKDRTLAAADNAVILVDGGKGLEPQTRKLFEVKSNSCFT